MKINEKTFEKRNFSKTYNLILYVIDKLATTRLSINAQQKYIAIFIAMLSLKHTYEEIFEGKVELHVYPIKLQFRSSVLNEYATS